MRHSVGGYKGNSANTLISRWEGIFKSVSNFSSPKGINGWLKLNNFVRDQFCAGSGDIKSKQATWSVVVVIPGSRIDCGNFVRHDGYYALATRASRLTHYEHRHDQVPSKASVLWLDPNSTIRHTVALYVSGTNEISMYGGWIALDAFAYTTDHFCMSITYASLHPRECGDIPY